MTTITLPLLVLRDILTNYEDTAALNAAHHFEQRQIYWALDASFPSRIVPATLARQIMAADPESLVFHVQLKALPAEYLDTWTPTAEYGVVWSVNDWRASAASKIQRLGPLKISWAAHQAQSAEEQRRARMIARIFTKLPERSAPALKELIHNLRTEGELRSFMTTFETALNIPIYEEPATSSTAQGDQGVQEQGGQPRPDCAPL
jgi:hypothetical protein